MDKRKQNKIQRLNQQKERWGALKEEIQGCIEAGESMQGLQAKFNDNILSKAIVDFSHEDYSIMETLLGKPYSDHLILLDECVNPALMKHVHTLLGKVSFAPKVFEKSVKDDDLFISAQNMGYSAILTSDHVSKGERDLCGIANSAYKRKEQSPHIIVLSQDMDKALARLNKNCANIRKRLTINVPESICDLN